MNPVMARELKERFRRPRAATFFTLWLLAIGLIGYLIYLLARLVAEQGFGFGGPLLASAFMGRFMFELLLLLLLSGVILVVPGVVSLSIVSERERLTLPLLQVSQLTPRQLIFGKLGSSMAYLVLLLVAVTPVLALPNLFGGVALGDVVAGLGMILATAVMLGCLSIWVSARARTTRGAVAGAYLWTLLIGFVTLILLVAEIFAFRASDRDPFPPEGRELYSLWVNPYFGLVSAVDEPIIQQAAPVVGVFTAMDMLLLQRSGQTPDGFAGFEGAPPDPPRRGPLWPRTLGIYALMSVLTLVRASQLVRAPESPRLELRRSRRAAS